MIMIGDQACKNFVLKAALTLSSGRFVYSCWWTPERECNHCPNFKGDFKFLFSSSIFTIQFVYHLATLFSWTGKVPWLVDIHVVGVHFSWEFCFEDWIIRYFSIYQMITFPGIKVHKSSKTFFNDYRCCQNKKKMEITSNVMFGITGTPDMDFHQDFP